MNSEIRFKLGAQNYHQRFNSYIEHAYEKPLAVAFFSLILKHLINQSDNNKALKILDVGCGDGLVASMLFDKVSAQNKQIIDYTGIDINASATLRAQTTLNQYQCLNRIEIINDNIANTMSELTKYDLIICSHTLHDEQDDTIVNDLYQLLTEKGKLVFFHQSEKSQWDKTQDIADSHFHCFPPQQVVKALSYTQHTLYELDLEHKIFFPELSDAQWAAVADPAQFISYADNEAFTTVLELIGFCGLDDLTQIPPRKLKILVDFFETAVLKNTTLMNQGYIDYANTLQIVEKSANPDSDQLFNLMLESKRAITSDIEARWIIERFSRALNMHIGA